ncbi:MAG: CDP-alcohol phosphatidyltransferase family protein [Patescibacteria group bacterium]|nr:CDP-alcohol phosphatidyltransferase family protein [Patescibacteria group bacterium]
MAKTKSKKKLLNVPNALSLFRSIVIFVVFAALFIDINFLLLQILVVLAIISDKIDGSWARHFKVSTKFGMLFDSYADAGFIAICLIYAIFKLDFPIYILYFGLPFVFIVLLSYLILTLLGKKILSFWDFGKKIESKSTAVVLFTLIIFYFFDLPAKEYIAWFMFVYIYIYLFYYLYSSVMYAKKK